MLHDTTFYKKNNNCIKFKLQQKTRKQIIVTSYDFHQSESSWDHQTEATKNTHPQIPRSNSLTPRQVAYSKTAGQTRLDGLEVFFQFARIPNKNISQNGNLPQTGVKIKHIWNHHLARKQTSPP